MPFSITAPSLATLAVLDTTGMASTSGNLAMQAADHALIPARPSRLDLQATMPTIETLMRLGMRDRFAFVLNQCPAGRPARTTEAASGLGMFGVLTEPALTVRADHQDALASHNPAPRLHSRALVFKPVAWLR